MGDDNVELLDLVERLEGRRNRRFRRAFVDDDDDYFPGEDEYTEWRLRASAHQVLDLLDRSPQAADVLMNSFILNDPGDRKVVWISRTHAIACEGPRQTDTLFAHDNDAHTLILWDNDSCWYRLSLSALEGVDAGEGEEALHLLHKVVALGTIVSKVAMHIGGTGFPGIVPGVQDFVSLARSRRAVSLAGGISTETGRLLAYHCSPMVELQASLWDWEDSGALLAEAMLANQCPSRLSLGYFGGDSSAIIAPALAATTRIEELTILVPVEGDGDGAAWDAVVRNSGIRALAVRPTRILEYRHLKDFWRAALANGALRRIDARNVARGRLFEPGVDASRESDLRECSEMIAAMIRSNPRITSLQYDPRAQDRHIMETRVIPIVHLNRFRPIVEATFDAGSAAAAMGRDRERDFSALIGSPLVRRHPELLYCLLRAGREYLLLAPTDASGRRRASARLARKRARG